MQMVLMVLTKRAVNIVMGTLTGLYGCYLNVLQRIGFCKLLRWPVGPTDQSSSFLSGTAMGAPAVDCFKHLSALQQKPKLPLKACTILRNGRGPTGSARQLWKRNVQIRKSSWLYLLCTAKTFALGAYISRTIL